jgi:hypothetical protein
MHQTIDFKKWLSGPSKPRTSYDLYSLWRASCGKSEGQYQAEVRPDRKIVITGPSPEMLVLVSGASIGAFKMLLEAQRVQPVPREVWAEVEEPNPSTFNIKAPVRTSGRFR